MIVQCEQCMAKYQLDDSRIPGEKATVRCSRCQHTFLVSKESLSQPEPPPIEVSLKEGPKHSAQPLFQCPNCGFEQPHSQECIRCGIIFSKYKPRAEMMPPPSPHEAMGFGLDENFIDEQVESGPMTYAGFWRRFGAYFIDGIVVGIIMKISMSVMMVPMAHYFSTMRMVENPQDLSVIAPSLMMIIGTSMLVGASLQALYFILMWGYKGATLGKMALGIRIVRTDGSNISYGTAFLRYIGTIISSIPFSLGFLWMLWDDKRQTWHDKIASTCVIRT